MSKRDWKKFLDDIQPEDESLELNSKLLLIDGINTFLRNFTIINTLNPNGHHIGGLVGFLKSLSYNITLNQPTRIILVFDGVGGSLPKKNLYPEYKSNRDIRRIINYNLFTAKEDEDEAIHNQMARLIQYLHCLPIDLICIDSLEADDIIGYLVNHFEKNDITKEITIVSSDGDFLQLISNKTQVYSPVKKKFYKPNDVVKEYKVHPNNFIIYKTLLGDKSDNIPGINGLGEKKLAKLFPSLDSNVSFTLKSIFELSEIKKNDNHLYSRVLERRKQLEVNYILMNLRSTVISPENIELINNNIVETGKKLKKIQFLSMYNKDLLGNNISNIELWLAQNFSNLEKFRK